MAIISVERTVLFDAEVAARWGCSIRTIRRRLQDGTFPLQPMPALDKRVRFATRDVEQLELEKGLSALPGRARRR